MTLAKGAWLTVTLCFAVMVIEGFDIQAMGVAAPSLGPELKLSREVLGQALSASNIGLVIGAIIGGWLADVFGRKPVLIGSVITFGVFTLMTMQAASFDMLFAARLMTGLGFGGALPNVMAIAADVAPGSRRGLTAAMMFCGMPAGGSIVALLSWLGYRGEWRPLFLIGGLIPLVLAPILIVFMKETQAPVRHPATLAAAVPWLAAVPLALVCWLLLDQVGSLAGAGSVGGVVAPWLGGVLGLLGAYLIAHRGPLFGGGRGAVVAGAVGDVLPDAAGALPGAELAADAGGGEGLCRGCEPVVGAVQRASACLARFASGRWSIASA